MNNRYEHSRFTKKREYEDNDKRKASLDDVFDSLLDIQHSLCNVLTLEMNEAITGEVQKAMEREAAYEAERKANNKEPQPLQVI